MVTPKSPRKSSIRTNWLEVITQNKMGRGPARPGQRGVWPGFGHISLQVQFSICRALIGNKKVSFAVRQKNLSAGDGVSPFAINYTCG